jgi:hypothetical protein
MVTRKGNRYCPLFKYLPGILRKGLKRTMKDLGQYRWVLRSRKNRIPLEYKLGILQCSDTTPVTDFFLFFPPTLPPAAVTILPSLPSIESVSSICFPWVHSSVYSCRMNLSRATDFLGIHTDNGSLRTLTRPPFHLCAYQCFQRGSSLGPFKWLSFHSGLSYVRWKQSAVQSRDWQRSVLFLHITKYCHVLHLHVKS